MRNVKRLAYGLGSFGEGLAFNMFYIYFSFFMMSVAGINPAISGTMSLLAIIVGVAADLFFGEVSDRFRGNADIKYRLLMCGSLPLGLTIFLMFTDFSMPLAIKTMIYFGCNILFWILLSMTDNNYLAMGTELTVDYDERTCLRSWATFFLNLAAAAVTSGVLLLVNTFTKWSNDSARAWSTVGALIGGAVTLSFFIAGLGMRRRVRSWPEPKKKREPIFKGIFSLLKVKQYRIVILMSAVYNIFVGLLDTSLLYLFLYGYSMSDAQYSVMMLVSTLLTSAFAVPVGVIALKAGKKKMSLLGFGCLVLSAAVRLMGRRSVLNAFLTTTLVGLCGTVFWSVIMAMVYDTVELDQLLNGKKREGLIVSFNSMVTKVGAAIGLWIAGVAYSILNVNFGPGGDLMASARCVWWFVTVVTALTGIAGILLASLYGIDRKKHGIIKAALDAPEAQKAQLMKKIKNIL